MKKTVFIILITLLSLPALAQTPNTDICVQNIEVAQQRYDEGRIQDIQDLLEGCLEQGNYNKAQKAQALRLLTLAYLFLEEEDAAEATMLELLRTEHEFKVNPAIDPSEFINLHDQFRYEPLFNLGVRYIVNFAQPIVTDLNSSLSLTNSRPEYNIQFSFFGIGANFEYEFADNFMIYPEIHFKSMAVSRTETQPGVVSNAPYITIQSYDKQSWLSLPVSVKYNYSFKNNPNLKLYANLGLSVDFLVASSRPADESILTMPNDPEVGFAINTIDDKSRLNFGVFGGGGVSLKVGEGFISLEARYLHSLTKATKTENILSPTNPAQINTLVQDDLYRLNHIAISVGYTANIYIPKQLR